MNTRTFHTGNTDTATARAIRALFGGAAIWFLYTVVTACASLTA